VKSILKKKPMSNHFENSRRGFIKTASIATVSSLAIPQIVSAALTASKPKKFALNKDDIILFVYELFDENVVNTFENVYYLNTEPLNLESRLNYVKEVYEKYKLKIYDYSQSNITILKNNGITDTYFLEYRYNEQEIDFLINDICVNFCHTEKQYKERKIVKRH
jgi:hypothetical protein